MKKIFAFFGIIVIGSGMLLFLTREGRQDVANKTNETSASLVQKAITENVFIENGLQVITLTAKGGYTPRKSVARAGVPTILRIKTNGTFDCSSAMRVPQKKINTTLPSTGTTDFDVGVPQVGVLNGNCSMGMYPFEVTFVMQ